MAKGRHRKPNDEVPENCFACDVQMHKLCAKIKNKSTECKCYETSPKEHERS